MPTPRFITSRTSPRNRPLRALAVVALACFFPACAGKKAQQAVQPEPVDLPPSAPSVRGSRNGMEMMCWGVAAGSRPLAELLAPYLDDTVGLDSRTRALWQSNGLRLVCVPIDRLDAIRQLLPQVGGVQRQWLGQVALWTDVINGTPWHDLQPVAMDNGRLTLGPGKVRILIRCWTIPVPSLESAGAIGAAMRTELLLQHLEPPRVDAASLFTRPTTVADPLDEGLLFRRLAASITLPPDRALLVIPESPQIDWRSLAQIPLDQLAEEQAALAETRARPGRPDHPEADGADRVGQVFRERAARRENEEEQIPEIDLPGPADLSAEYSRTLGELLLTPSRIRLEGDIMDRPAIRSILVLVPRIPDQFSIERPAPSPK